MTCISRAGVYSILFEHYRKTTYHAHKNWTTDFSIVFNLGELEREKLIHTKWGFFPFFSMKIWVGALKIYIDRYNHNSNQRIFLDLDYKYIYTRFISYGFCCQSTSFVHETLQEMWSGEKQHSNNIKDHKKFRWIFFFFFFFWMRTRNRFKE